jgi:hypothetical protein
VHRASVPAAGPRPCYKRVVTRRTLSIAAGLGGLWGLAGYAILWGYTPLVVHRPFVVGPVGTILLLPVRVVLWVIRLVEDHVVAHSFDFSANHGWIGLAAGIAGAMLVVAVVLVIRAAVALRSRPAA